MHAHTHTHMGPGPHLTFTAEPDGADGFVISERRGPNSLGCGAGRTFGWAEEGGGGGGEG